MDLSDRTISITLGPGAPARLDKALAEAVPASRALSRSRLQALIADGAVSRDGTVLTDAKARVAPGETLVLTLPPPAPARAEAEAIALVVVWEDADLIVIDKPAGMVVHPAPGAESGTLVNALLHHCGASLSGIGGEERPGIVHRIDKDTSGLLVVAKSDRAHHGLAAQFAAHSVERSYDALCWGCPDPADPRLAGLPGVSFEPGAAIRIEAALGRHKTDRKKMAVRRDPGARHAVTRLWVEERFGTGPRPAAARLTCRLETGRTHQIRVHCAHVGHPLMGDPVYGGKRSLPASAFGPDRLDAIASALAALPGQALHAATLGFDHPVTGEPIRLSAPPPAAFTNLSSALRGDRP
ncbi:RNA pseudouridine synthase [Halovulum dunhuangense]|uniref:RNA pseudouridine synthase n=1 Tax=Halovulum dunhuangense TaxID=1505036 RepID=A0A849L5G5_9RHOB|nr:pseudouridine synthase [Halovulum dunhuangense]NNU81503.1 RNA pseudouridine synthase [Halovulum dunhuangense]